MFQPLKLALVVLLASLWPAGAFSMDPAKDEADAEASVRKAAKTAEIHCIAVRGPNISGLIEREIRDCPKVFELVIAGKGAAGRVKEFMPDQVRKLTVEDDIPWRLKAGFADLKYSTLPGYFLNGFRDLLERPDFYNEEAFKGVKLDKEMEQLLKLGEKRSAWQTACLNWRLVDAALGGAVRELPMRFRTISVEVKAGQDVVLVLSSRHGCRWEVDVKPGGRVTGAILCGYGPQEVEWIGNPIEVPVVYRAGHTREGKPRLAPKYIDGITLRDDPRLTEAQKYEPRRKFEAGIKEIIGAIDFTSTTREESPTNEPYVIRPLDK